MHERFSYRPFESDQLFFVATPQQGAERWAQSAQGATQKYTEGIQRTDIDVTARAIAAQGAMVSNFNQAVSSGRWARRLTESGGTANWKAKSVAKAGNYATGVAAAQPAYLAAAQQLYPFIGQLQANIRSMPSGTLAASIARSTAWITGMANYRQSR